MCQPRCGCLKMEIAVLFLALGAAAYYAFRNRARRGLEIVRSQVFLSGLHSGNSVPDANYAASFEFVEQLPAEVIQSAAALAKAEYEGKSSPIIAEAYQRGMKPRLPIWQRIIILGTLRSPHKHAVSRTGATPSRHALNLYRSPT